ncbi:major capsid protein [Stenotrophomonas phage SOVA965]
MKTYAEQIADLEATREAKTKRMKEVVQKSMEDGRSMDTAESEEFDTIENEIKALDADIKRLGVLAKIDAATVKAVNDPNKNDPVVRAVSAVQVKNTQKQEPGVAFAQAAKCLALGSLEHRNATDIAKSLYAGRDDVIAATEALLTKAAVAPATTTDATWAQPLVQVGGVYADFVEFQRAASIMGRFGVGGVPALRRVPFRVPLVGQTSGGDGYWTGEGQAKPLTKFDFASTILEPLKVANIAVATMELIRDSSPSADLLIRDSLAAAINERLDTDSSSTRPRLRLPVCRPARF